MAYGGWLRDQVQVGPYPSEDDTNMEAGLNALINSLAGFAGWSVKKVATKHYTNLRSYHAVAQHSGGAELALLWSGSISWTGDYQWHDVNHRDAVQATLSMDHIMSAAYMPPGKGTFDNAKSPRDIDWLTGDGLTRGFKVWRVAGASNTSRAMEHVFNGSSYAMFTWQVRGDDVMLAIAQDAQHSLDIDFFRFWGTGISPMAHVSDTEQELFFGYQTGTIAWSTIPTIDCHNAAGTLLLKNLPAADNTNYLSATYTTPSPYRAAQLEISNDLGEGPVFGTDGLKGKISDEVLILTAVGAPPKSTWNSGTHVHLRSGVWVGSDSGNSPWP